MFLSDSYSRTPKNEQGQRFSGVGGFSLGWVVPLVSIQNPYLDSWQDWRLLLPCDCNPQTKDLTTLSLPRRKLGSSLLITHAWGLQKLTEGARLCLRTHPYPFFFTQDPHLDNYMNWESSLFLPEATPFRPSHSPS